MKIAIIAFNKHHAQEMSKVLESRSHSVFLIDGAGAKLRVIAEQDQPDLMLVEAQPGDATQLEQIEYVTTHRPQVAVILLSCAQTPELLLAAMRAGVREVLTFPVAGPALDAAVTRIAAKLIGPRTQGLGKIFAFISCKGGSGATFLATNLGYQLARDKTVLLIDLNLQFGDALSFVHDQKPPFTIADIAQNIGRLDAQFLESSVVKVAPNFSVLAAPEDPAQAVEVRPEHMDAILSLAAAQYDFVLLDMGRTFDPVAIKALDQANRIFPVLQLGLPYLRNASKMVGAFRALGYPPEKVEPVVNRFHKASEIGIDKVVSLLGTATVHTVPNSYKEVSASINHGDPLLRLAASNAVARSLAAMAHTLCPQPPARPGLLGRLFNRDAATATPLPNAG